MAVRRCVGWVLLVVLGLAGCEPGTVDAPPPAGPSDGGEDSALPVPPGATVYTLGPGTRVSWEGSKRVGSHTGAFEGVAGRVVVPEAGFEGAVIEATVRMESLSSDNRLLTRVLRGDAWFDIDDYPVARFRSTAVEPVGETYVVVGDLTMKGRSRQVTFPVRVGRDGATLTADAQFTVQRSWWGVGYDDWKGEVVEDTVQVAVYAVATEAATSADLADEARLQPALETMAGLGVAERRAVQHSFVTGDKQVPVCSGVVGLE
jgi:polyisoprenoid-binding protein YceI